MSLTALGEGHSRRGRVCESCWLPRTVGMTPCSFSLALGLRQNVGVRRSSDADCRRSGVVRAGETADIRAIAPAAGKFQGDIREMAGRV